MDLSCITLASTITDYLSAACALVTTGLAIWGVQTWRHQLKGGAEYALAKDLLKATYNVQAAFSKVRHPAIWSQEYPLETPDQEELSDKAKSKWRDKHVYQERWKSMDAALSVFSEQARNARVEWGPEFDDFTLPIIKLANELASALSDFLDPPTWEESVEERRARQTDVRLKMYDLRGDSRDVFGKQIENTVASLEMILRNVIGKSANSSARKLRKLAARKKTMVQALPS